MIILFVLPKTAVHYTFLLTNCMHFIFLWCYGKERQVTKHRCSGEKETTSRRLTQFFLYVIDWKVLCCRYVILFAFSNIAITFVSFRLVSFSLTPLINV
jgi:hypothetical protein